MKTALVIPPEKRYDIRVMAFDDGHQNLTINQFFLYAIRGKTTAIGCNFV
jgi:hypothetical protein